MPASAAQRALLTVVAVLSLGTTARAAVWRVVGVSADGDELAAVRVALDPLFGFHRHTFVRFRLEDGAVLEEAAFVAAARHADLRARGDFDLLRWERGRERQRRYAILIRDGWRSCRPLALRPLAPPTPGPDLAADRHGGAPAPAVRVALPDGPRTILVEPGPDADRVVLRDPALAPEGDRLVGAVPVHVERPSPFETIRFPLAGVRDVLACGALDDPTRLVVVVETIDPPQPDLPPAQHLVVGGRHLTLPSTTAPAAEERP